ncbi:hypothetical protein EOD40_16200 [Flavobacterium sufflavum]|uniref:Nuclear transport factor 2 family protein n=1 Tax=Flavobacterium sufflavum TaxID=1921138 RepID=A0A437KMB9_9FLAO|nr:hypothetical protein [Flavobacterium sufflavum]RVT72338.1 hypothetical protein EOD40_16200 [Flavobacterium sufflavum]
MQKTITFLILFFFNFGFCQTEKEIKNTLEKLSKEYLTEMYMNRKYEKGSDMWDNTMLIEIQSFYNKTGQGNLSGSVLIDKIKVDVNKYFNQLTSFKVDKILSSEIEYWDEKTICHVFIQYSESLKHKSETIKTMLTFIPSKDKKTWTIQDWKIKDILDKVNRNLY